MAVPGKQSWAGSAQLWGWRCPAVGLGPPVTLSTDCGEHWAGFNPLPLVKGNPYPSRVLLALSSCSGLWGIRALSSWLLVKHAFGSAALWLLPTLGCLGAPGDLLKRVCARSSIYCELQSALGMCVLDFFWRRLKLQTLFLVWANVLCPGMGVSSSQRLLGSHMG